MFFLLRVLVDREEEVECFCVVLLFLLLEVVCYYYYVNFNFLLLYVRRTEEGGGINNTFNKKKEKINTCGSFHLKSKVAKNMVNLTTTELNWIQE